MRCNLQYERFNRVMQHVGDHAMKKKKRKKRIPAIDE